MGNQDQIQILQKKLSQSKKLTWLWLFLIAISVGINIYGATFLSEKHTSNSEFDKYTLIDKARQFIEQKDVITNLQPLRDYMRELVADDKSVDLSIYFEFLNTGSNISINPELKFYPASLIKLPTIMVAMKKVELGQWRLDNELVLMPQDRDAGSGEAYAKYVVGTRFTIEELMRETLLKSDNTTYNILRRNITAEDFTTLVNAVGLYNLFDADMSVTSKEYSRLLRALYTAAYLSADNSQQILNWMTQSEFKDFLSQGVPENVSFAHKWGQSDGQNSYLDSGIVYYPNRPYIITVMIRGKQPESKENFDHAVELMNDLSTKVYEFIKSQ